MSVLTLLKVKILSQERHKNLEYGKDSNAMIRNVVVSCNGLAFNTRGNDFSKSETRWWVGR